MLGQAIFVDSYMLILPMLMHLTSDMRFTLFTVSIMLKNKIYFLPLYFLIMPVSWIRGSIVILR